MQNAESNMLMWLLIHNNASVPNNNSITVRKLYARFSRFHSCGTYSVLSRSPSIMIGNAAFANDQDSTWFWSPIENFGYIFTSKSYVGYALVQSISINRASLYALYCGTFHAAQDNIIIVTMQSKIPMRLTATKLLPDKVHALRPAVLRWHASANTSPVD